MFLLLLFNPSCGYRPDALEVWWIGPNQGATEQGAIVVSNPPAGNNITNCWCCCFRTLNWKPFIIMKPWKGLHAIAHDSHMPFFVCPPLVEFLNIKWPLIEFLNMNFFRNHYLISLFNLEDYYFDYEKKSECGRSLSYSLSQYHDDNKLEWTEYRWRW